MRATLVLAGALWLVATGPACAADTTSVSYSADTGVVVTGSDQSDRLHFERHGTDVYIQRVEGGNLTASAPCQVNQFGTAVTCATGSDTTHAAVRLGLGDDAIDDSAGIVNFADGGPGNDNLMQNGAGPVTFMGGDGDDSLQGTPAGDHLYGGTDDPNAADGNDTIVSVAPQYLEQAGSDGDDVISGGAGNDTIAAGVGNDTVTGDAGDDQISGCGSGTNCPSDGDDVIDGGAGNDKLSGHAGSDTIYGGEGDDVVSGGDSYASGMPGTFSTAPPPAAPDGNDVLDGGPGGDIITGAAGDDKLTGGNGDDNLKGGTGADVLDGGGGVDRVDGSDHAAFGTNSPDDGAVDDLTCGTEQDSSFPDGNDVVSTDCESIGQELTCPPNASGSCPITMDWILAQSTAPSPGLVTGPGATAAAAPAIVLGSNETTLRPQSSVELPLPFTSRGIAAVASAGRPVVTSRIVVRDRSGAVLSRRQVNFVVDTRGGTTAVPRTADVLSIASAKAGAASVRLDIPAPGRVKLTASARVGKAKKFAFAKATLTQSAAGVRTVTLKPSKAAKRAFAKRKPLAFTLVVSYQPTTPAGIASTRSFNAKLKRRA